MVKERKLRRWLVSVLSGAIVATSVLGSSFVSYAVDDDLGGLVFDDPDDNGGDQGGSSEEPSQDEPEVKENITESGNGPVYTDNSDGSQSVSYDKEVSGMLTEDSTQKVVDEKTAEQEQIKADIEGQGGSYDYTVETGETIVLVKKEIEADSKEDAEAIADNLEKENEKAKNIEVKSTPVKAEEPMVKTFGSVEEAQAEVDRMNESDEYQDATLVSTEDATITIKQTDFEGYSVEYSTDENGEEVETKKDNANAHAGYHIEPVEGQENAYKIVITGGIDEINIDLLSLSVEGIAPGDTVYSRYTIVNESGDDYEVVDYQQDIKGMARWIEASFYDDEDYNEYFGKELYRYTNEDGVECVAYEPKDLTMTYFGLTNPTRLGGMDLAKSLSSLALAFYYNGTPDQGSAKQNLQDREKWAREWTKEHGKIDNEDLLAFYNEATGIEHDSLLEAWRDFFKQYGYDEKFWTEDPNVVYNGKYWKNNAAEAQSGSDYLDGMVFSADKDQETRFVIGHNFNVYFMDNLYEDTTFTTFNMITIKAIEKILATIDYSMVEYSVVYDEETDAFVVTIDGSGYIPGGGGGGDDPGTDPGTPTVIPTPGPAPAVLGAQRPVEAPAVLGARRAGTSDETNMVLRLIVMAAAASVLVIARKKSENR